VNAIEELLDIEAIKNIRVMYSHYFDGHEMDKLVELFTEDAVCEFGPKYGGDWVGRETMRENFQHYADGEGPPWSVMHATTNPVVRLTGPDTAEGRCYLIDMSAAEGIENPVILLGIYDDLYRKIDGRWLIERTRIDFLWPNRYILEDRAPK
jgi:hypothetical protein